MTTPIRAALVTGATGFIGGALSRRLAGSGAHVTCLVRPGSGRSAELASVPGIAVIEPPSFETEALRAALSDVAADVVFHLASYGVRPDERDEEQLRTGNVVLTERLLYACAALHPRRFVYTGTCTEYGAVAEPERLTEQHALAPASPYGAAKVAAERQGTDLARELGIPFVPLRLFGVYGAGEAEHRLVPYLIGQLRRDEAPSLTGGEQARDLMYVEDMVDALIQAATAPGIEPGTPYNVCTGEPVRIRAVAAQVAALLGKPSADLGLGRRPYRSDESMWIVGDPARFRAATGWTPAVDLVEGIRRTIAAAPEVGR